LNISNDNKYDKQSLRSNEGLKSNGSYSNLFMKKKVNQSTRNGAGENSLSYIKTNESNNEMNIIDEDVRMNTKLSENKHRPPSGKKISQRGKSAEIKKATSKSTNMTKNIAQDRILSPKTNYNFKNDFINKSINQIESSAPSEKSRKSSFAESGQSSVHLYLQRRHTEAQQKLLKLKTEKIKQETEEVRDRPAISKNSQKIAKKLSSNQNVVERLTNKRNDTKKQEEISKIFEINNKCQNKPIVYYSNIDKS
jgi:hypothetical protein